MERRTLDSSKEAQVPPRGKRVAVAQWNERVQTNQRDGNS
jgi:hypothetical protein